MFILTTPTHPASAGNPASAAATAPAHRSYRSYRSYKPHTPHTRRPRRAAPTAATPAPTAPVISGCEIARLTRDPELFARQFVPYHCRHAFNAMHLFSFEQYKKQHAQPLPGREGQRLAIAAPRGAAKSTMHTLIFPLMDLLSRRERHIVIISATLQQSQGRLASITRELRHNQAIRDTFFGGRVPKFKSTKRTIDFNGVRIEAFSAGSEMRGISHGEYRPTRIILDDVEQSRLAQRSGGRTKIQAWYDEVVENLGDNYTHITIVGTILHRSSLLSTLIERPGFKGQLYKSVISWAERQDLWTEWQRIFTDRSDPDAVDNARNFYHANKEAMMKNTEVFWETKESYLKLMQNRVANGNASFMKEKQNSPLNDDDRIFDTSRWNRFISPSGNIEPVPCGLTLEQQESARKAMEEEQDSIQKKRPYPHKKQLKYYGFLDPALGKSTTRDGDYAAIVTVGRDCHDTFYVMDVWMEKVSPLQQIKQVFTLHQEYNYELFGYESNGFQETFSRFMKDEQKKRQEDGHRWQLPIKKINNAMSKHARIAHLEPGILCGSIMFQQNLKEAFYVQADEYNGSPRNHDDGLDALASCIEMAKRIGQGFKGVRSVKGNTPRYRF